MKRIWTIACIIIILGLTSSVLAGYDLFGTIKQLQDNEYKLYNLCSFESIKDFKVIYPKASVVNKLLEYELKDLIVTESPLSDRKFYKELTNDNKSEWQHDLSLIDYLQASYWNENSEIIKLHYKIASRSFIPQLEDYTLDKIRIGELNYNIYHDDNSIHFITFDKELWGNKYNVHVELLKITEDNFTIKQFEKYKDKDELIKFLKSLSLEHLIK